MDISTYQTPPHASSVEALDELKRLFCQLDEDGDGKISPAELQNCIRILGEDLPSEDAEEFVRLSDTDGDGLLCFDEFAELVEEDEGEEERRNFKFLREAFSVYEMEGEGCITPESLGRALDRLGKSRTVEECEEMIRLFDVNGDGVICFDEFKSMML